jgi:hypothetical protein
LVRRSSDRPGVWRYTLKARERLRAGEERQDCAG